MNNKFVRISDLYSEIIELFDYYHLKDKYIVSIHNIFEKSISCAFQSEDWCSNDYISINKASIIKEKFNRIIKVLMKGVINNEFRIKKERYFKKF